jgi:hypothetical protein
MTFLSNPAVQQEELFAKSYDMAKTLALSLPSPITDFYKPSRSNLPDILRITPLFSIPRII